MNDQGFPGNEILGPSTPETRFRYAKVLRGSAWVRVEFDDLKKGDRFLMYEWDGTLVDPLLATAGKDAKGGRIYISQRQKLMELPA